MRWGLIIPFICYFMNRPNADMCLCLQFLELTWYTWYQINLWIFYCTPSLSLIKFYSKFVIPNVKNISNFVNIIYIYFLGCSRIWTVRDFPSWTSSKRRCKRSGNFFHNTLHRYVPKSWPQNRFIRCATTRGN